MTEVKMFEVRDDGTHVPMMATRITVGTDDYQMLRAGWRVGNTTIYLTNLITTETQYDEFRWSNSRTFSNAHRAIKEQWDTLRTGDVVDVEFELKETTEKKVSERIHQYA